MSSLLVKPISQLTSMLNTSPESIVDVIISAYEPESAQARVLIVPGLASTTVASISVLSFLLLIFRKKTQIR